MRVSVIASTVRSKAATLATLLKTKGFVETGVTIFNKLSLPIRIRLFGNRRTVTFDGCTFPIQDVPNTLMKLELLRGSYEGPERSAASRYINPEWPVIELGGCIGVLACTTNKLLRQPVRHVVVEANPFVIAQLEGNRFSNHCSFSIIHSALAYDSASIRLMPSPDFWGTSLYELGNPRPHVDVPTTQLRKIAEEAHFEKFALICDIEGQEYELVKNELETLKNAMLIIMEIHPDIVGEDKVSETLSSLGKIGFEMAERTASVVVLRKV